MKYSISSCDLPQPWTTFFDWDEEIGIVNLFTIYRSNKEDSSILMKYCVHLEVPLVKQEQILDKPNPYLLDLNNLRK